MIIGRKARKTNRETQFKTQKIKKKNYTHEKTEKKRTKETKNTKLLTTQNTLIHLIINLTRKKTLKHNN